MRNLIVFHNPDSGDAEHDRTEIMQVLTEEGYQAAYYSTKKEWKLADLSNADLVVIAGGDGTVRKVAGWMLESDLLKPGIPLTVLPLGTANNLSKTLGIHGQFAELIRAWKTWEIINYDLGRINNKSLKNDRLYFLEAMGCGLFVHHLHRAAELQGPTEHEDDPEKKIAADLRRLLVTLKDMRPIEATIKVDQQTITGTFLLVEVMNSRHLGTNLEFNPGYNTGDGKFEVVMITVEERDILEEFIKEHIDGRKNHIQFKSLAGENVEINCSNHVYHLDDELYSVSGGGSLCVAPGRYPLKFLAPKK